MWMLENLVRRGMAQLGLSEEDLQTLPRSEERKVIIAAAVKTKTTVPLSWIAERLGMGSRSTVSREVLAMKRRTAGEIGMREAFEKLCHSAAAESSVDPARKSE